MKYVKFIIEDYRAVSKAIVEVSNNLIPIIGINESGKTTILQAILSFDKNKDRYNKGSHLIYKNKYEIGDNQQCKITAEIKLENREDLDFLSEKLSLVASSELYKKLEVFLEEGKTLLLSRDLKTRTYHVDTEELLLETKKLQNSLANALYERLPFILYFDDFSDRVPETISFSISLKKPEERLTVQEVEEGVEAPTPIQLPEPDTTNKLVPIRNGEWHSILEEVFKRSTQGQSSLQSFIEMDHDDDQQGLIQDIVDTLHKEVIEDWKKLKQYGGSFGEEPEELQLLLKYDFADDKAQIDFKFQVEDRTKKKGRFFNITERSKGFQWFFNFIMMLKFNPKYQADQKGAIYLLDEPGSYLHTSAQEELLKKLKEISETNTILFCTHSQYLLDPGVINIARIKLAKKESGIIDILPFNKSGVSNNEGALTPLYQALRVRSGVFNKTIKFPVITEGVTDFYLFDLITKHKNLFFNKEVTLIPGGGANHLRELISQSIAFSENYLVLLDSDEQGDIAYKQYKEFFGDQEIKHIFQYQMVGKKSGVVLEDFLSTEDQTHLQTLTGIEDVKMALPALYYLEEKFQKKFVTSLNKETWENLKVVQGRINSIV